MYEQIMKYSNILNLKAMSKILTSLFIDINCTYVKYI